MISVASYCRVSTDKEDQTNSFAAQQRYFSQYIAQHPQWNLHKIYADQGITGTSAKKRPQFLHMIQDAQDGQFQLILTKEVSRFSRNLLDTIAYTRMLKAMGVFVVFLTDGINTQDPDAELRLSIMASIAQEESRKISARVKWGQTRQMEQGVVFGRSLLGYEVKAGSISIDPEGAKLVQRIFRMYTVEQLGSTQIANILTREGICTPTGNPIWTPGYILKILTNEKYKGDLIQKKSYTPDYLTHEKKRNRGEEPFIILPQHHSPIISPEIWELAQQQRKRRDKHRGERTSVQHPLSGKILCGVCGAHFVARQKRSSSGAIVLRWSCSNAVRGAQCGIGHLLRDDDARQMLRQALAALQLDRDTLIVRLVQLIEAGLDERERKCQAQQESLRQKIRAVMDAYFSGKITTKDMQEMKEYYQKKLDHMGGNAILTPDSLQGLGTNPHTLKHALGALLNGEQDSDALCRTLIDHIVIYPDHGAELTLQNLPHIFRFAEQ